jgi:hypothetical protein
MNAFRKRVWEMWFLKSPPHWYRCSNDTILKMPKAVQTEQQESYEFNSWSLIFSPVPKTFLIIIWEKVNCKLLKVLEDIVLLTYWGNKKNCNIKHSLWWWVFLSASLKSNSFIKFSRDPQTSIALGEKNTESVIITTIWTKKCAQLY